MHFSCSANSLPISEAEVSQCERIIMSFNIRKAKKTQLTTDDCDKITSFIMNDQ